MQHRRNRAWKMFDETDKFREVILGDKGGERDLVGTRGCLGADKEGLDVVCDIGRAEGKHL